MDLLNDFEGGLALALARHAIERLFCEINESISDLPPIFDENRGVFVTLKRRGELRGCIGFPYPVMPLRDAVVKASVAAATEDPRFWPVDARELEEIDIEITVLTPPSPLVCSPEDRPRHIIIGKHGLIVKGMNSGGLLLPQVATEWEWDVQTFLDHTCMKAGLQKGCWRRNDIEVLTFEGQIFYE